MMAPHADDLRTAPSCSSAARRGRAPPATPRAGCRCGAVRCRSSGARARRRRASSPTARDVLEQPRRRPRDRGRRSIAVRDLVVGRPRATTKMRASAPERSARDGRAGLHVEGAEPADAVRPGAPDDRLEAVAVGVVLHDEHVLRPERLAARTMREVRREAHRGRCAARALTRRYSRTARRPTAVDESPQRRGRVASTHSASAGSPRVADRRRRRPRRRAAPASRRRRRRRRPSRHVRRSDAARPRSRPTRALPSAARRCPGRSRR